MENKNIFIHKQFLSRIVCKKLINLEIMNQKARYFRNKFYLLCDTVRVGKLKTGGRETTNLHGRSVKTKTDEGGYRGTDRLG